MLAKETAVFAGCILLVVSANYCPDRDLSRIEGSRRCRKPCSDTTECRGNKTCQCDGLCGMSCFNENSECKKPDGVANGEVRWDHLRWGGTVRYSCKKPYALVGSKTRQCHTDREWSGLPPMCQRGCHAPKDISFAYSSGGSDGFLLGASYSFKCFTGYYLNGNSTRTCTLDGWTDASFECLLVDCGALRAVPHGEIVTTKGLKFGSVASLQCNEGYRNSSPRKKLRCFTGEDGSPYGEWEGELPSCEIVTCSDPLAPEHGSISNFRRDASYGETVQYNCNGGFKIFGPKLGRCNIDGNWGEKPSCVEDFDCDFSHSICDYTEINWSRVNPSGSRGDFVLRSDGRDSFFMSEHAPRHWSSLCITFRYKLPARIFTNNALAIEGKFSEDVYWRTLAGEPTNVWQDAEITISLLSGRSFQFHSSQESVLLDDIVVVPGECNNLCQNVTCLNGGVCYSRQNNFLCLCKDGFYGTNCENKITCSRPVQGRNSQLTNIKQRWEYGDEANYTCDDGYVNIDPDSPQRIPTTITCQSNGTWSGVPLKCFKSIGSYCILVDTPDTGPFAVFPKRRYSVGDSVLLVCAKGYELDGQSSLKCQSMLTWEKEPPKCRKISCGRLPRVAFSAGSQTPVLHYGESVNFAGCYRRYYMDGPKIVTCRFDGTFSAIPACRRERNCEDTFPMIINGRKIVQERVANFFCNSMYKLIGNDEIRCRGDGTWEHDAPYCKEVEASYRTAYAGIEYLIFMDPSLKSAYDAAQDNCERLNSNVAIIYSSNVRRKIEKILTPVREPTYKLYIGLKSHDGSEFEWDLRRLRTNLDDWKLTSDHRHWYSGAHYSPDEQECAVIERTRPWNWFAKKFGWIPTNCLEENYFICQRDYDLCTPNPCVNRGTCISSIGGVRCICRSGYAGANCSKEVHCSVNDLASNIVIVNEHFESVTAGTTINIECKDGYRLVGSATVTCSLDGSWSNQRGKCQEITCNELHLPETILVKDPVSSFPGSQALLYCPEDYALEGYAGVICGLDGEWSNINATCTATKCEAPHLPHRSYIKEDVEEFPTGISVTLGCLDGRRLDGSPTLRCENGQWSSTTSKCIVAFCTIDMFLMRQGVEIVGISLVDANERKFDVGEQVTLRCEDSTKELTHWNMKDVEPVITCSVGGRWSPRYRDFSCEV